MEENKIKRFNESDSMKSDINYDELRQKFFDLIADNFANNDDDYPTVENVSDESIKLVKEFLDKGR